MAKKANEFPKMLYVRVEEAGTTEEWLRAEESPEDLAEIGTIRVGVYELKSVGDLKATPRFVPG
jgi:hypothetical protein